MPTAPPSPAPKTLHKLTRIDSPKQIGRTFYDIESSMTQQAIKNLGYALEDFEIK